MPIYKIQKRNGTIVDFDLKKIEIAIDKIAPLKNICIKNPTPEWIDLEIIDGIRKREQLFKKFKKIKNHTMITQITKKREITFKE